MDRNIATVAKDGVYRTAEHVAQLMQAKHRDPRSAVDAHVRRLEALRRTGIVERVADGVWKVPPDLLQKARTHDAQKDKGMALELRSHLSIHQQVRAIGATWLDRQLVGNGSIASGKGFGAEVRDAMRDRVDFLATEGLAEWRGQRVVLATNLLATLRDRELAAVGNALEKETGQIYRAAQDGRQASGIYQRSIQLISGRFAILDEGLGFTLVPWKPMIERLVGKTLAVTMRGSGSSWEIGRQRGNSFG